MQEVEVGFKIKQTQAEAEDLLQKGGYELLFNTETHDLYFSNKKISKKMTEQQIKFACIRFRHTKGTCGFDNYQLFDTTKPNRFKCSLDEAAESIVALKNAGFNKVFDTFKTDFIYKKGKSYHQLQNINKIGLLDYYYDEDIFSLSQKEQFDFLYNNMLKLGFELEYTEGVDKLKSLLSKKLCFSKNQNGDYSESQE